MMKMDILIVKPRRSNFLSNSFNISKSFRTFCSNKKSQQPQPNPDDDDDTRDNKTGTMKGCNWDLAPHSLDRYNISEQGPLQIYTLSVEKMREIPPLKSVVSRIYTYRDPKRSIGHTKQLGKFSTDWDKAWSSFKKQGKKSFSSQFTPNKYVTWNPRRSNYPLSEEVDPIKRTERSNLMLWTSPKFTLSLAIVIISLLLIYTILAPTK